MYARTSLPFSTEQDYAVPQRFQGRGLVGELAGQGGATLLVPASEAALRAWSTDSSPDLTSVQQNVGLALEVLEVRARLPRYVRLPIWGKLLNRFKPPSSSRQESARWHMVHSAGEQRTSILADRPSREVAEDILPSLA